MGYFFLYDPATGIIQNEPARAIANPWPSAPASWVVLGPVESNDAGLAYLNPARYLIQGTPAALVAQPYLTVSASVTGSTATLTATLNDPPSTPPTSVTFTVAGNTFTAPLSSGTATLTVDVHPSVAPFAVPVSVAATGVVEASVTFGGAAQAPVQLQCVPLVGGTVPTVTPCGAGSEAFLQGFYASGISPSRQPGDIATADSLALQTLFGRVIPALTGGASPLLTLTTDEQNAVNDVVANLLPALPIDLANAYPSGGTKAQPYAQYVTDQQAAAQAFAAYAGDLKTIPGLA